MRMVDLIIKKREKFELTEEEIKFIINGYVNNEIVEKKPIVIKTVRG